MSRQPLGVLAMFSVLGLALPLVSQDDDLPGAPWPTANEIAQPIGYDGGLTCVLHANDWASTVDWYQKTLGFQLQYRLDEMQWAEMHSSVTRVTIGIGAAETPVKASAGNAALTFGVKDIEVARKVLEERGVVFDGPTEELPELVKLADFHDPSGNRLTLAQSLQR